MEVFVCEFSDNKKTFAFLCFIVLRREIPAFWRKFRFDRWWIFFERKIYVFHAVRDMVGIKVRVKNNKRIETSKWNSRPFCSWCGERIWAISVNSREILFAYLYGVIAIATPFFLLLLFLSFLCLSSMRAAHGESSTEIMLTHNSWAECGNGAAVEWVELNLMTQISLSSCLFAYDNQLWCIHQCY